MNILIIGQPSNNRGDEAAARGYLYAIKKLISDAKFNIVYSSNNLLPVIEDTDYITNHHKKSLINSSKKNYITLLFYFLLTKLKINFKTKSNPAFLSKLIQQTDAILFPPAGPYLGDYCHNTNFLFYLWLCKSYKKKVMIYDPSIGPFSDLKSISPAKIIKNFFLKKILNKIDLITLRDKQSFDYIKTLNLKNKNIFLSIDSALQNPVKKIDAAALCKPYGINLTEKPIVGITPIDLQWHGYWSKIEGINERITTVAAQALDHCISKFNSTVIFFPQLYGKAVKPMSCDIPVMFSIIDKMKHKKAVNILSPNFNTEQQQAIMEHLSLFIGFRHHSAVLSAKMNLPCVCVSYEHKATSFMEDIQLEKYVIELKDLTAPAITSMIDTIWSDKDNIIKHLNNIHDDLQEKAFLSSRKFHEMIVQK